MKIDTSNSVFVFDLDDTLYKEADYQLSGMLAVTRKLSALYRTDAEQHLKALMDQGEQDLLGGLCRALSLPESVKESLLWEYRLHAPAIALEQTTATLLDWLQSHAAGLAILTDGRALTQRLKITALGLGHIPLYISEEYLSSKPDPARFRLIQASNPDKPHVYIADNPGKDFLAPNQLGWTSLGLRGDRRNIHSQDTTELDPGYLPHAWLADLDELRSFCH